MSSGGECSDYQIFDIGDGVMQIFTKDNIILKCVIIAFYRVQGLNFGISDIGNSDSLIASKVNIDSILALYQSNFHSNNAADLDTKNVLFSDLALFYK